MRLAVDLGVLVAALALPARAGAQDPFDKSVTRNGTKDPHPYATSKQDVLENVVAAFHQTHLDDVISDPRFGSRAGELRAGRLLDVKSLTARPDYYVLELVDGDGSRVGRVAITKDGTLMHVQPTSPDYIEPRSADLEAASTLTKPFTTAAIRSARFVYLDNVAEIGNPVLTPVLQIVTDEGTLYINSKREAFAEEGSPLDRGQRDLTAPAPRWRGSVNVRKLSTR